MKVSEILGGSDGTLFSLEVFPPKVAYSVGDMTFQQHMSNIFDTVEHLKKYDPAFVSVTYNPEGKTRATSIPIAAIIKQRFGIEAVAHLTCIATPRDELRRTLDVLDYFDIDNILALQGDRPDGHVHASDCMNFASELVGEIRRHSHDFCIGVAGYPEGHPVCLDEDGCRDLATDLENLKFKVDQGADFCISQLFMDNGLFFDYVDRARKLGIDVPIIPGIMPVISKNVISIVKSLCGASIPEPLERRIADNIDDPAEVRAIGIEHAVEQCRGLMDRVPCIHFYTMDMWEPVEQIIDGLDR